MLVEEEEPIRREEDLHSALEKLLSSGFDKLRIYEEEMAWVERLE